MFKDYNDVLVMGLDISSLKTIPIDSLVLQLELDDCSDKTQEYKVAQKFCKTVRDNMVKSDMAKQLSERWNKDVSEVKEYINYNGDTDEELLASMHGFEDCFTDFRHFIGESGEPLGFKSIDESLDGMKRKEVCILGAYSNQGKSFISSKIVAYRLLNSNDNIIIFSMEQTRGQYMFDIIREIMHMNTDTLKEYMETDKGIEIYEKVKEKINERLKIVDDTGKNVDDLFKYTQACFANGFKVDLVVFDHFHLIPRVDEFGVAKEQADKMKVFVKKFNLRLIMLAQFNEESQKTFGKQTKPYEAIMTHIKGANDLKAIADIILLVWRPYMTDKCLDEIERESRKFITCIKIGKSRREIKGKMYFEYQYDPETTALKEVSPFE